METIGKPGLTPGLSLINTISNHRNHGFLNFGRGKGYITVYIHTQHNEIVKYPGSYGLPNKNKYLTLVLTMVLPWCRYGLPWF